MGNCKKCNGPMSIRTLRIVNGKCWRCYKLTKIAMVESFNNVEGPREFSDNEIKFSKRKGVIIKDKYSQAIGESYLANECCHCHSLIGDSHLKKDYSIPSKDGIFEFESKETEYCFVCDRIPTIGEEFLIDFFNEIGITAKFQKKLLENQTTKKFYVADFYLKRYRIYVEFLGEWDKEESRKEYINKMNEYADKKNSLCLYLERKPRNYSL